MYRARLLPPPTVLRSGLRLFLAAWVIALIVPTAFGAAQKALLYAHGQVTVNGAPVSDTTILLPGDRVRTAAGSAASIVSQGSITTVPAGTALVYGQAPVPALKGAVKISEASNQVPLDASAEDGWWHHRRHKCVSPDGDDRRCKCDFDARHCRQF